VNQFLNEFEQMRKIMRTMLNKMPGSKGGGAAPGAIPAKGRKMPKGGRGSWFSR
jgi:signal recognition particle GTPase